MDLARIVPTGLLLAPYVSVEREPIGLHKFHGLIDELGCRQHLASHENPIDSTMS